MSVRSDASAPEPQRPGFTLGEQLADLWQQHSWLALGLLWALALYLAYVGFLRYAALTGQPYTSFDLIYLTIQLIGMNSGNVEPPVPWQLEVARFLLPLLTAWTAARALALIFHDRWQQFLMRTTWRNHVVICGLSQEGWLLAKGFASQGQRVVVITLDESSGLVGACRAFAVVLIGDAADPAQLPAQPDGQGARPRRARRRPLTRRVVSPPPSPATRVLHVAPAGPSVCRTA